MSKKAEKGSDKRKRIAGGMVEWLPDFIKRIAADAAVGMTANTKAAAKRDKKKK